jgi:glycosyltransferase involved in cell wall biosynthesis
MNVLTIISYPFLPATTGGEICTLGLHNELAKTNQVTVFTVEPYSQKFSKPNFELLAKMPFKPTRYMNVFVFFTIKKLIKQKQIDLLFFEQTWFGWLLILLKIFTNKKVFIRAHNIEHLRFKSIGKMWWKLLFYYEKWTYNTADKVFFLTEEDRNKAIEVFGLTINKTQVIPYGVDIERFVKKEENAIENVKQRHQIKPEENILLFYGTMGYKPNDDAVLYLLEKLQPALQKHPQFHYKIVVCGKNLPLTIEQKIKANPSIIYAGFVENLNEYIDAAKVVLNPVITGGGVKTKAIDALARNANLVSTESGAIGIEKSVCGNKLIIVPDNDVNIFAQAIINACDAHLTNIPNQFYQTYYWGNIIKRLEL